MKVYIIGSLRNAKVSDLAIRLRAVGLEVFDDWMSCGPQADDIWQEYEKKRGRSYKEALNGHFACNGFALDKKHIDEADVVVLLMPGGKSAHLELGYAAGIGKRTYILFDEQPERFDLMYKFATDIFFDEADLHNALLGDMPCNALKPHWLVEPTNLEKKFYGHPTEDGAWLDVGTFTVRFVQDNGDDLEPA